MKKIITLAIMLATTGVFSQVGIGTASPHSSAILDLTATDKAMVLPRVANTAVISSPINGMMVYDISSNSIKTYENGVWIAPSIAPRFATSSSITSNSPGNIATDDFVFGSTSLDDITGTTDDSRMFFDKSKGAFRAGTVDGTQWNNSNIGNQSTAMGYNTTASGIYSTAMGVISIASGDYSTAIGAATTASGVGSTAIGFYSTAKSHGETAIGTFNTDYTLDTDGATKFNAADRLFVIGNGTATNATSDALVMLKNGNTTLKGTLSLTNGPSSYTLPNTDGTANQVLTTNGSGTLAWAARIPYIGATTNADLGEFGISAGYFQPDLTPTSPLQVGRMQWNPNDGTMDLRMGGNQVTQQIGQESFIYARNNTGSTLLEGKVVKITGSTGTRTTVALAQANNISNARSVIGIATENISNNNEGLITNFGLVRGINTSSFSEGDILYLSTSNAGEITNIEPTNGNIIVRVGICVKAHITLGAIMVGIDYEPSISALSDVSITAPATNNILTYNSINSHWENKTIASTLGYTPANIDSPTFTGTPTLPIGTTGVTQIVGNNSTALATTAFVTAATTNAVREVDDEFTATAAQTTFTLTQTPSANSKVKMYIKGIRISKTAYSLNGTTLTYVPANNGTYSLAAGDRIQIDYYY